MYTVAFDDGDTEGTVQVYSRFRVGLDQQYSLCADSLWMLLQWTVFRKSTRLPLARPSSFLKADTPRQKRELAVSTTIWERSPMCARYADALIVSSNLL